MINELGTHSRPPAGRLREELSAKTDVRSQLGKCLIVSASQSVCDTISLAANEAGWDTIVCSDELTALAAVRRVRFQLAWVDLESPQTPIGFRDLCQSISTLRRVLLVICGHASDVQEEIWARQLGIWLYLPGVSLGDATELALLCEQAQLIAGNSQTQL